MLISLTGKFLEKRNSINSKNLILITLVSLLVIACFFSIKVDAKSNDSTIQIRAGFLKNKGDDVELEDGVKIIKDDINLKAPRGTMNREEKKIILTEGIEMNYNQGKIKSLEMTGWLNDDRYLFESEVVFDYQPQEEGKKGFVLKAPYLEMRSEEKSFIAKKGVTINYDQKLLKAEEAEYIDQKEHLILRKNVSIKEENGDWVKSKKAIFDLSSGEEVFTADGDVEIEIKLDQEKNGKK